MVKKVQVVVVGGGHAGCEAALASARMGVSTLLVTLNRKLIGRLSCNPAVGGIAKSHLVSEVDALGGEIGRNADYTGIQYRMLNTRKGPAVRSNRIQCDKSAYPTRIQAVIANQPNLEVLDDVVIEIGTEKGKIKNIVTRYYGIIYTNCIVICTGTFLRGRVLVGDHILQQGRMGEEATEELSSSFMRFGFKLARLKTGTPPRLHRDSINYSKLQVQLGEIPPPLFSRSAKAERCRYNALSDAEREMFYVEKSDMHPWVPGEMQMKCYLTHTNERTHQIIVDNLNKSSMYSGLIEGAGVRYCPSIEDKVVKFEGRSAHHVFIEPEGRNNVRIYPSGISNSLPVDVQIEMIHSIKGLEYAEVIRPGYAIEYDFSDPTQLYHTLETKKVEGLYFAGQINGTTGYEEASSQGFTAGINAAAKTLGVKPLILSRNESYIGVLIDDLVTKGTDEPYRMFTSRSEHRLTLRQDNAAYRMCEKAKTIGILSEDEIRDTENRWSVIKTEIDRLEKVFFNGKSLAQLLRQLDLSYEILPENKQVLSDPEIIRQVEIEIKYAGYIRREKERIKVAKQQETWIIPTSFNYDSLKSLRYEAVEKLKKIRPVNIGQASRISGVNPSDIAIISMEIKHFNGAHIARKERADTLP